MYMASISSQSRRKAAVKRARAVPMQLDAPYMVNRVYNRSSRTGRIEVKGIDIGLSTGTSNIVATTNNNDLVVPLNLIQMGAGSWNRVGRQVKLLNCSYKLCLRWTNQISVLNTNSHGCVRVVFVWDKSPNSGTIPKFDDIFGRSTQGGAESTQIFDALRWDNTDRFAIVHEKIVNTDPANKVDAAAGPICQYHQVISGYFNLKGRTTTYSGQSAPMTIADISTGALYIVLRSTIDTPDGHGELTNESICRLKYVD